MFEDEKAIVVEVFGEFSCGTKRTAELKDSFEFVEFDVLLRHVCINRNHFFQQQSVLFIAGKLYKNIFCSKNVLR